MVSRAQHRRATLLKLGAAAVDLFEQQGASVTVDAIAHRAGVSRRTVFRYIDSKEELAFVHPILWFEAFDSALHDNALEPLRDRLLIASRAIGAEVDADPDPVRRAFLVAAGDPALLRGFSAVFQRWVDRIAEEVAADPTYSADPFRARIVGGAVMGMVDAVTRQWLLSPPEVTYSKICEDGFMVVAPMFEAGSIH